MAYAIGYCLPIVGIILLSIWIISNLQKEAELKAYMKKTCRRMWTQTKEIIGAHKLYFPSIRLNW